MEPNYNLQFAVRNCHNCVLSETRNIAVPGWVGEYYERGGMGIICEAPGKDEDEGPLRGQPLVGRAGKLLDRLLLAAGLDRSEMFLTNRVRCRPPGGRIPVR